MAVIRENTEGEYANVGGFLYRDFPEEVGVQTAVFTRRGCERVITYAFDLARKRRKKLHVTSITKSNAQGYGMVTWDRAFDAVASRYPDIQTQSLLIDAACMDFVRRPETFDVVVASNLFGDILTDIGVKHFLHDVATTDKLLLDVELRNRGPLGEGLDALTNRHVLKNVHGLVVRNERIQNLHHGRGKTTLGGAPGAFHKKDDLMGVDQLLDSVAGFGV